MKATNYVIVVLLSVVAVSLTACGGTKNSATPAPPQKTTPTITWPTPTAITYGIALGGTQLDATANVAGSFAYTPALGTVPVAGTQTLSVTFTPTDTTDYTTASASVQLVVNKAVPIVSAWPTASALTSGQALSASTLAGGTASVAGTFAWTAPGTVPTTGVDPESVTFTPTDTADYTSVAGSVNVTVAIAPIVISSISPNSFFVPTATSSPLMTITGSGFAGGQLFYASGYPNPGMVSQGNPATTIQFLLNVQMRPRFVNVYGTQADGTGKSNTIPFATLGTVPIAAACSDYIFADSQGDGIVRRFNRADGTHMDLATSTFNGGISADCNSDGTTNAAIINYGHGLEWLDSTGNITSAGSMGDGNTVVGVVANKHVACTIEPSIHVVWCVPYVASTNTTPKLSALIGTPVALTMTSACGGNMLFVLDGQGDGTNLVLYSFSAGTDGTLTPVASLSLPGFTPVSKFTQSQLANFVNWQVVASQTSCTAAVMAPVLNGSTGIVSFALTIVNGSTMAPIASAVALPSGSYQISQDDIHGAALIYVADMSGAQGVDRTWSRPNSASATMKQLASTSTILNMGPILSADGSTIDVIGWDPANDSAGLQLQPIPNK